MKGIRLADRAQALANVSLWSWGLLHVLGGVYVAALLLQGSLLTDLGVPAEQLTPEQDGAQQLIGLTRGLAAVWAGCIIGLGVEALWLAHTAFREGRRWAWVLVLLTIGPADAGAAFLGLLGAPGGATALALPVGLALFLAALVLSIPAVWLEAPPEVPERERRPRR